jgi:hypothetical protein
MIMILLFIIFSGNLRLWNSDSGKCVFTTDVVNATNQITVDSSDTSKTDSDSQNIVQMIYNKQKNNVTVVTFDQNISILGLEKLRLQKQVRNCKMLLFKEIKN